MNPVQFGQINITNAKVEKWGNHSRTVMNVTLTGADKALSPIDEFASEPFQLRIDHERDNYLNIKGRLHSNGKYAGDVKIDFIKPEQILPLISKITEGVDSLEIEKRLGQAALLASAGEEVKQDFVNAQNEAFSNARIEGVHNSMVLGFADVIQNFEHWIENPNEPTAKPVIEEKPKLWDSIKSFKLADFLA